VRQRFLVRYASRLTNQGEIVISSQRYRDQGRNILDAKQKLSELLASVAVAPKKRRPTKPSRSSVVRRVESKQARSKTKKLRGRVSED
jgi:ribosome-associated protein